MLADLRAQIQHLLTHSTSDVDALAKLQSLPTRNDQLASFIAATLAKGDLAGNLFVHDVEATSGGSVVKLDIDSPPATFLNLPFEEAIAFAQARGLLDDEGLADLLRVYRERGIEASELMLRRIQQRTAEQLTRYVANGGTLDGFTAEVEAESISIGLGPRSHSYLENVFRTGVQSAYGAGRFRGLSDPVVIDALPARIYRTVGDSRVRAAHAELDGMVWDARVSDEWRNFSPPLGYQCRCSMVTGTDDEIGAPPVIPAGLRIDFYGPPTDALQEPLT